MSRYEGILIFDPELTEEERERLKERIKEMIQGRKGEVEGITEWGRKRLAYPVKKRKDGFYILLHFRLESELLEDLIRSLRLIEAILKYLITKREG